MSSLHQTNAAMSREDRIERGRSIYTERLRIVLEPVHVGRYVAIEPETGRYFLGDTEADALIAACEAMPDKLFYLTRVGYRAAHTIGGYASRVG